ncbi:fumarylacetoacetate hydrolase family protein [Gallaecimonas pentaromativorans]|uniref:2-keto-4-pentenoate hydratase/2-oxohepta-3-ene-1,7-dioic acid hydratase in catechol pathway n=1 Tax=Gallaecimonas pentaromativorans TaxID=584787 RepID=A0A3N1PIG9_9GAMM|nr:fumarylacetoacetate hydrolase family protein [Gallaecimonas pentaromativorans]ROQ24346.1 2-keto-4-pentenoate hydratase/2-oxohepta-3-ene-1,7-dioic acid hydratase in catechol pathway [Gallaecimonas pentaromativorans]
MQLKWNSGEPLAWPRGKVVCVGRNYAEHAKELGNAVPERPLLFMKPATALVPAEGGFSIDESRGQVHYECELAVLVGKPLTKASAAEAADAIAGFGLALDLTLRDLQSELKEKGHPWELAKAFDGSCVVTSLVGPEGFDDLGAVHYQFFQNGELRQDGHSSQMITPITELLALISTTFTLEPGDLVLTGTPKGVGVLQKGDTLRLVLEDKLDVTTQVG